MTESQLIWCREKIKGFAEMESSAIKAKTSMKEYRKLMQPVPKH